MHQHPSAPIQSPVSSVKGPWKLIDLENNFVATKDVESAVESIQGDTLKVIGIVGAQCGGKSSLLNAAFNTLFKTQKGDHEEEDHDEEGHDGEDYDRTTCGIDVCVAPDGRLVILDIEGSDSDTREDSGDTERRFMTFALLNCDMVIINMQENCIGRKEGFNSSLLSNAFEARLNIGTINGGTPPKTLLLFALRDSSLYDPGRDLSKKQETEARHLKRVREKLNILWGKIEKPESCIASMDDFFDIDVRVFPNKRPYPDTFHSCAEEFGRTCREDSGLTTQVHSRQISPEECFSFMRDAHEAVKEWKPNSIPLEQSLQCLRAVERQRQSVTKEINTLYEQAKTSSEHPFPTAIPELVKKVHEEYEQDCRGCHASARDDKKTQLMDSFRQQLQPLFDDYKLQLSEQLKQRHKVNLEACSAANPAQYLDSARKSREDCVKEFGTMASKSAKLTGMEPLLYNEERDNLDKSLKSATRDAALTWAKSLSRKKGEYEDIDLVALKGILKQNASDFAWQPILEFYKLRQSHAEASLRQSFRDIGIREEDHLALVLTCSSLLWEELVKRIRDFFKPITVMIEMYSILSTELEKAPDLHDATTHIPERYVPIVESVKNYLETVACIRVDDPNLYAIPANVTERGEGEDNKWHQVVLEPDQVAEIREMFAQELKRREAEDVRLQTVGMVWRAVSAAAVAAAIAGAVTGFSYVAGKFASDIIVGLAGRAVVAGKVIEIVSAFKKAL